MTNRLTRVAALAAVTGLTLTGALVLHAGSAAADTAVPPWQQAGQQDPNEVGTLSLYDASGAQITSGSVNDDPIAAYAVGSAVLRAGDTKATLYGALPKSGQPQGAWTVTQLSGSTTYPSAGAPSSISTTEPVYTGSSSDSSIADLVATTPNNDTSNDGYAGLYELRVRTSAQGQPSGASYDALDIAVSGGSWQVVYPAVAGTTTTVLSASRTSGAVDSAVTLTATISPSATAGTVQFADGASNLGTPVAVSGGVATTSWTPTIVGDHALRATFVPDSGASVTGSNGTLAYTATKAQASVLGTWSTVSPVYGAAYTVSASVTAHGVTPTGIVRLLEGTTVLGTATLAAGRARITVKGTSLTPGSYTEVLSYAGNALVAGSATTKKVVVQPASSTTRITLSAAKVMRKQRARVTIVVTAAGVVPTGTIYLFKAATGARIAVVTLTAAAKGRIVVSLPLITKVGTYSIHAKYLGSALVRASTSASAKLTVKKA